MKKTILALQLILLAFVTSSCSDDSSNEDKYVDVKVSFCGLNILNTLEDVTRHETRASDKNAEQASVTRISLKIFDQSGTLISSASQDKDNDATNFGKTITCRIPVGSYKFVAVAHKTGDASDPTATINSATEVSFGSGSVNNPTYTTVQDVTVSGNTTQAVNMDMGTRKNATFTLKITDITPADVTSLEMIINPTATAYTDLLVNPATGLASSPWQYKRTIVRSTIANGTGTYTNNSFALPLFLTAASETLDITINALNADSEVLYTRTLTEVTLQQAHRTLATGTFFSPEVSSTFTFDKTETTDEISLD